LDDGANAPTPSRGLDLATFGDAHRRLSMILHSSFDTTQLWTHWLREPAAVIGIAVACGLYVRGTRMRSSVRVDVIERRRRRARVFALGAMVIALALVSPVDALADDLFAAHMAQHILLAAVAPPLLVASHALNGMFRGLPVVARRRIGRALVKGTATRAIWRAATSFAFALPLHVLAILVWHLPTLYLAALNNPVLHGVEHLSFLITGCLVWWRILRRASGRRTNYAQGIAALFAVMMISGVLGALLVVANHVWYPAQELRAFTWGLAPLDDQRIAGLLMWVVGGLIYVVEISVLFMRWFRTVERTSEATALS
jgi:putative membrane protein